MSVFQAWFTAESIRFRVRALKARFRDQKAEFDMISRHVRPGDVVCDIGANKGGFIVLAVVLGPGGRVVAFEPQPELARGLADVCRAIELRNVQVEAKAVYSHSGEQDLFLPAGHQPGASLRQTALGTEPFTTLSVPLVALDDYFGENANVTLLKIDVEGAELGVLKGAERILRQRSRRWCSNARTATSRRAASRMCFPISRDLAMKEALSRSNRLFPIAKFDAAIHQRQDGEWFWKSKDYCNNFVFAKTRRGESKAR